MNDLKQFIDSKISQSESIISDRLDGIDAKIDKLQTDLTDGFEGIGTAIEEINDTNVIKINTRLSKLEARAA